MQQRERASRDKRNSLQSRDNRVKNRARMCLVNFGAMSDMRKKYKRERKLKKKCVNRTKRVIRYGDVMEYEYLVGFNDAQRRSFFFLYKVHPR